MLEAARLPIGMFQLYNYSTAFDQMWYWLLRWGLPENYKANIVCVYIGTLQQVIY
jgi:hypothetical protein